MLNISDIKAAREKAGMTQATLAEKCGTRQQTIEKIEGGKVKRTSYLPEIHRALSDGGKQKDMVDRVALAIDEAMLDSRAMECGEKQRFIGRAAIAAVVRELNVSAGLSAPDPIDDPLMIVRDVLQRHDISPGALAEKANIAASTLTRALNDPSHKSILSTRTLQKIREWDRATQA